MLSGLIQEPVAKEGGTTTDALAYPTIATLLVTGAVVSMACRTPNEPFRTWFGLLADACGFLLLAAVVHVVAVWGVSRVFRRQLRAPVSAVARGAWLSVGLLPPFMLLATQGSAWAVALPPAIAVAAVLFVRRGVPTAGRSANAAAPAGIGSGLFVPGEPLPLWRTLLPMVMVAVAVEGAVALLLSWQYALGGLLLGAGAMMVAWRTPLRLREPGDRPGGFPASETAVALVLTAVALAPSMGGSGRLSEVMRTLLRGGRGAASHHAPPLPPARGSAQDGALSGVILTLPPKPQEKTVPPPPPGRQAPGSFRKAQPLVIPFDGAYWYFRSPERQPRADARVVRGDSTKVVIRSTDLRPLQMEAHQRLSAAIGTDCCRAIRVAVRSANDQPGVIALELLLEDGSGGVRTEQSLEVQVLPSSEETGVRPGKGMTDEELRFDLPAGMRMERFDEITVRVKPGWARSRVGAHVAVQRFELVP